MTISGILATLLSCLPLFSQEMPIPSGQSSPIYDQKAGLTLTVVSVTKVQDLSFGTFSMPNSGGTIVMPANGSRRATGDIVLVPSGSGFSAIFDVVTDNTNLITITIEDVVNLTNGTGGFMTVQIDDTYPVSPFTPVVGQNLVKVGGTLTVGTQSSNPAGAYSGSFEVTINQE